MKQRILAILLSLTMMFTLVPTAMAEGETAVAKVGNDEYETLAEAVANAEIGDTIVMTADTDISKTGLSIVSSKDITLDLNGYEVKAANTGAGNIKVYGKLTLKDSTDTSANGEGHGKITTVTKTYIRNQADQPIIYAVNGDFVMQSGLIDTATGITNNSADGQFGVGVQNETADASVTINGGKIKAGWYAVAGNGTLLNHDGNITVNGGILESTTDYAIYNPQKGTTTINGGVIYGQAGGIAINCGSLVINDGMITSKGIGNTGSWGDGTGGLNNAAIHANAEYGDVSVSIKGGKVTAEGNAVTIDKGTAHTATVAISGGTFSSDISEYCEKNYYTEQNEDNTYTVKSLKDVAVAQIGDTYYKTLAEAVAAAKNDETVTLLKNAEMTETIRITDGKKITLALDGHDVVIKTTGKFFLVRNGELTVTGTGMIKEETPYFAPIIIKGGAENSENYSVVNVEKGVILEGWAGVMIDQTSNTTNNYGMVLNVNGATLKGVKDTDNAEGLGVYVNGVVADAKVTLNNATLTADGYGMYLAGNADTTITGGTVSGTTTGIEIRAGKLTLDNCDVTGGSGEVTKNANGNGSTVNNAALAISQHTTKKDIDVTINGGTYTGTAAVYQTDVQGTGSENVKVNVNNGKFNGTVVGETANKLSITGGYFTSDPTAYLAASHYVWASDKDGYTYMVKNTAPTSADQKITVVDKTDTAVSSDITGNDEDAINGVISKANVDGVAEAVAPAKKADIVAKSSATVAENDKVEIEVAVKVEAKAADLANGKLTFEASPVATVKVNGTATGTTVPVTNDMLNGNAITVKLPLPTGFKPEQIKHISSDGSVEYFLKTAKRGANTFEIKDGCAVFTITKFSTFELSGTVTYVEPSYYSGSSSDPTYSVTVDKTENGSVTVSPKSASKGDTVTITVKPDSGYVLETLTVTDKNGNELTLKDKGDGKYTFTMPAGKVEVKATFMEDNSVLNFFYDVPNDAYFYEAVKWAVKNGITTGVGNDLFAPEQPCTRAQIVTFLWRAAGSPEPKTASSFTDVPANAYYAKAVAWAVENGITNGMTETTFAPNATCTRGQSVTFLHRALKGTASGSTNFTDVKSDAFYADAINWAVANNVTNGTSNTTFSPNADCTRAEIVTFLYRAYQGK